ncbi:MAG: FKBP-type peptidyl-prolyl cis-trans isomerase [Saprospiraceae bacterium]|nr:FKBP-type peptidyl-prolyl cis-trans isomerase [Saprospiraceae bacterium]
MTLKCSAFLSLSVFGLCFSLPAQTITEHGYRYVHHIKKGGTKPQKGESIMAHVDIYAGDVQLSSSRKNGSGSYRFDIAPENETLTHYPPLYDAALLMSIGDSLTIFQDVDENMRRYLPLSQKDAKEIRFELVLLEIVTLDQKAAAAKALEAAVEQIGQRVKAKVKAYNAGLLNAEIVARPSGLKMLVEEAGQGAAIQEGEPVQLHYYGCLLDGSSFDNSYIRRQTLQFAAGVGQMIAGFDEGVMQLRHGARAYLFVPPALGYGDQEAGGGAIPANSELVFYIEIF